MYLENMIIIITELNRIAESAEHRVAHKFPKWMMNLYKQTHIRVCKMIACELLCIDEHRTDRLE